MKLFYEEYINKLQITIVVYNVLLDNCISFKSIYKEIAGLQKPVSVLVYDNSPQEQQIEYSKYPNCNLTYISDKKNNGIGKAYNAGADLAGTINKSWLLFADQDTLFPPGFLDVYFSAIIGNPSVQLFCPILKFDNSIIVSPSIFKFHRGFAPKYVMRGLNSLYELHPINSGMCVSLNLFKAAMGYNEAIKLDYSDFDFIKRVKKIDSNFIVLDIIIKHSLSAYESPSLTVAKVRFSYLCQGALLSSTTFIQKVMAMMVITVRCIKLIMNYKNLSFIKIAVNAIIAK